MKITQEDERHFVMELTPDDAIAAFMAQALAFKSAGYIAHAEGVVARANSMTQIAIEKGLLVTSLVAPSPRMATQL